MLRLTVIETSASPSSAPPATGWAQVDLHQVDVGAAGEQLQAAPIRPSASALALARHRCCRGTLGRGALNNRLGRDVHQRPALHAGEHGLVDRRRARRGRGSPAPRPAEGLVGGRGHEVGVRDRVGCSPAATRPAKCAMSTMSRAHLVGDPAEAGGVEMRGYAEHRHDQPRAVLVGEPRDLVEVDPLVLAADARRRRRRAGPRSSAHAVGEVAAVVERMPRIGSPGSSSAK